MRGARVASALARNGFDVTVALGGPRPDGVSFGDAEVAQLPPVMAGPSGFSTLVGAGGAPLDEAAKAGRRDRLLDLFGRVRPDILLIEAFPFGRRGMRFELLPLLEAATAARPRPLVAASIRDILQENRGAERTDETVDLVRRFFDLVVVHGEPALAVLADSFPAAGLIEDRVRYSGLVGPDEASGDDNPPDRHDVIVSVGGGAVGADLLGAALGARALGAMRDAAWLVLTGPNLPAGATPAPTRGVTVRRFVPNLTARLKRARMSISQAGYNTAADLLAAPECRAVLVPYADGGETEQTRRASLFERAGRAVMLPPARLAPGALAEAMRRALDMPQCSMKVTLDGADRTAALLGTALKQMRGGLAKPGRRG